MSDQEKDLPSFPTNIDPGLRQRLEAMREAIQSLMGKRGDKNRAAVRWSDLVKGGIANPSQTIVPGGVDGSWGGSGDDVDLTKPPVPTGLDAAAGLANIMVRWDVPIYFVGHKHKETRIYATKQLASDNTLYTFNDAVKVDTVPGSLTIRALPSDLGIKWRIWITWVSNDGAESLPAGGINGLVVTTGRIGNADLGDLIIQSRNLADGAVDLSSGAVKADGAFGALAVGYTVTQYLIATSGILQNLVVDDAQIAELSAAKLTAGDGTIGGPLKSSNFVNGVSGWRLLPNGAAQIPAASILGQLVVGQIDSTGLSLKDSTGAVTVQEGNRVTGRITLAVEDGLFAGTNVDNGVYMGLNGIRGRKAGVTTFSVDAAGNATFAGDLVAAGGTFAGSLQAATGEFAGVLAAGVLNLTVFEPIVYEFTSPGTYSLWIPSGKSGWVSMNMKMVLQGAGAGGGGGYFSWAPNSDPSAGGGGGGAGNRLTAEVVGVVRGQLVTIEVGDGGNGGNGSSHWGDTYGASIPAQNGANGGNTTVWVSGVSFPAYGGVGGTGGSAVLADEGNGNPSSITYNVPGGWIGGSNGGSVKSSNAQFVAPGGQGGASFYGGGGAPGAPGGNGSAYGAGGGGGDGDASSGGNGMAGYARIEIYDPNTVVLNNRYSSLVQWLDTIGHGSVPVGAR